jgi:predicted SAM-dependent methyltransferase
VSRWSRRLAGRLASTLGVSRFAQEIVRAEVRAAVSRLRAVVDPRVRRRVAAVRQHRGLLANVGSGPAVLTGFVNLDVVGMHRDVLPWDSRRTLPFADASCRGVRLEHFLEHLDPRHELPALLAECRRVLEPGGVVRIIVPDAARFLAAYVAGGRAGFDALAVPDPWPNDLPTPMDVVNHTFHQWHEHRWAYDEQNLGWRLRAAGFVEVTREGYGTSRLPELAQDAPGHEPYSLYVDAVRPGGQT